MIAKHFGNRHVGGAAIVLGDDLANVDILDRVLIAAKAEIASNGLEIGLADGIPKRIRVAEVTTGSSQGAADQARRIVSLTGVERRVRPNFSSNAVTNC